MREAVVWYFAAQFSRLAEVKALVEEARMAGVEVNSRWLNQYSTSGYAGGPGEGIKFAERDLEDIEVADALLFFAEDPTIGIPRGGRHVEFGYALALDKRIEVVGPKENVFHLLSRTVHWPDFKSWLASKSGGC